MHPLSRADYLDADPCIVSGPLEPLARATSFPKRMLSRMLSRLWDLPCSSRYHAIHAFRTQSPPGEMPFLKQADENASTALPGYPPIRDLEGLVCRSGSLRGRAELLCFGEV